MGRGGGYPLPHKVFFLNRGNKRSVDAAVFHDLQTIINTFDIVRKGEIKD